MALLICAAILSRAVGGREVGEITGISWTDHTFNPWWGCTRVSPGCENCYAETFDRRVGGDHWGPLKPRRTFSDKHWNDPIKWDAKAKKDGINRKVFCASMADVMDTESPAGQRERLWELIDKTPNLIWQLLTKRPENYHKFLPSRFKHENVWLGVTAEDQGYYDKRWPILLEESARRGLIPWISYEPALGPLTMTGFSVWPAWIIFGGESGANRRPCQESWLRVLVEEIEKYRPSCQLFVKQMSARTPTEGKALIPTDLLIHNFP
jgi:protein gp37